MATNDGVLPYNSHLHPHIASADIEGFVTNNAIGYRSLQPQQYSGNYMNTCESKSDQSAKYFVLEDNQK